MSPAVSSEGYRRALAAAAPNFVQRLSGTVGDGYWLDDHCYFFCVGEDGIPGPRLLDAASGRVAPPLDPPALARLLAIDPAALADARYDMPGATTLVVTLGGEAHHVDLAGPTLAKVETLAPVPSLHSPDGRHAAFLEGHDIWLRDRADGAKRPLSSDGERYFAYGAPHESGVMPILGRRHPAPQGLWSADSQWLVVQRVDERGLAEGGLVEHVPAGGGRAKPHLYKVAGPDAAPATLHFVAFHVASGRTVSSQDMPCCSPYGAFAWKLCWFAGEHLYFIASNRFGSEVALVEMRLDDGALRTVLRETAADGWVDIQPLLGEQPLTRILPASSELIFYSDRDGFGRLFLHDLATGALRHPITPAGLAVREIVHVDEGRRRRLFLASGFDDDFDGKGDLGARHLCAIGLDGDGFERFDLGGGDVAVAPDPISGLYQAKPFRPSYAPSGAAPDGARLIATIGSVDRATRTLLVDLGSGETTEIARTDVEAVWNAPRPRPIETVAADGVTRLFGALHFPTGFDPQKTYPLIVYNYPGPQTGLFARRLPSASGLFLQSVAELGAIGLILETRGLPNRGRAFHRAGDGLMHEPQLADHVAAIAQLCRAHAFIDRTRIGIFGSSGGGYLAARALFDYPDVFKVGVAVAGMHDSRNYAAVWADRYGGPPGAPQRELQSNIAVAHQLEGKLCLIHGDLDDNVHPAHTLAVVDALIEAGKPFDLLIVPGAGHGVLVESAYAYQRMLDFFARHLIGAEPPAGMTLRWTVAEMATAFATLAAAG
jgi:dipeptidyl-peptidase-4